MKRFIKNYVALIIASLLLNPVAFTQTESGMSLGKMKFIQAPPTMKRQTRCIKMTMSRKVVTPRFCARVGGVAFVQIAEPEFSVKSFSLKCDKDSNAAFAVINGTTYRIPLDVWQLETIARYADDSNNAAVTLFGKGESQILFHDAFIDRLMGLRILQTDLLLAGNYLDPSDRGLLPSNDLGEYIMSDNEITSWRSDSTVYRILYDTSIDTMSLYATDIINYSIDSIGEYYTSYVYTDFDEPITFGIEEGSLTIHGLPYYRFTRNDKIMDTIETYQEIVAFLDSVEKRKEYYDSTLAMSAYMSSSMPITNAVKNIVNSKKNKRVKAKESFAITNYYEMIDSVSSAGRNLISTAYYLLRHYLYNYIDSVLYVINDDDPRTHICLDVIDILKRYSIYDAPALAEYAKIIIAMDPYDSIALKIGNVFNFTNLGVDDILILHMDINGIHKPIFAEQLTNYLKENRYLVRLLNPIVIDAAKTTCQWAAFFRYAKQKNPNNWKSFLKQINTLKYDAPIVRTPIGIERI